MEKTHMDEHRFNIIRHHWPVVFNPIQRNSEAVIDGQPRRFQLWSWRESNPRPNKETISFLHAYSRLWFSCCSKTWTTNYNLIP